MRSDDSTVQRLGTRAILRSIPAFILGAIVMLTLQNSPSAQAHQEDEYYDGSHLTWISEEEVFARNGWLTDGEYPDGSPRVRTLYKDGVPLMTEWYQPNNVVAMKADYGPEGGYGHVFRFDTQGRLLEVGESHGRFMHGFNIHLAEPAEVLAISEYEHGALKNRIMLKELPEE
ncbi:MAG: hypothetical protein AAGD00_03140 [Planctomycetota bacterium]